MRGEKPLARRISFRVIGSPPLARGKVSEIKNLHLSIRITPACAGKSPRGFVRCSGGGDHPRLRGEKGCAIIRTAIEEGSPPLARGKVYIQSSSGWCTWDHPRLRGEKFLKKMMICMHIGSPPLARGKAGLDFLVIHGIRITPACAGKRFFAQTKGKVYPDHPRLRGEKQKGAKP